jgi:hypothetical protein
VSLAIKYENVDDARMRLRQTVVLYKGAPVLIKEVSKGEGGQDDVIRVSIQELPSGRTNVKIPVPGLAARIRGNRDDDEAVVEKRKFISSKHFDIAPFRMGYVNSSEGEGAFYCSRLPARVQKQGLCGENFKGVTNSGTPVNFNSFLMCKETLAMVANEYPSFNKALAGLDRVRAVAFHRDFCLVRDEAIPQLIYLYHKGEKVGMHNKGEIALGPKFTCLKESLGEMQLKVGAL